MAATTGFPAGRIGAITNAAENGFLAVAGDAGAADFGELVEEARPVGDGAIGAARQAVNFNDLLGDGAILKRSDGLSQRAAMRRQHAADSVRHANFVKRLDGVEDMNAVLVEVGHAGGFIKTLRQALEFGTHLVAQCVGLSNEPSEAKFGSKLVGSIHRLAQVTMFFEREEHAEKGGVRQAGGFADLLERHGRLAVEAIENLERAANGAQIIALVRSSIVRVERPLGNATAS